MMTSVGSRGENLKNRESDVEAETVGLKWGSARAENVILQEQVNVEETAGGQELIE